MTGPGDTVRGVIDRDGRLVAADEPLLALHLRAGGEPGGVVAIPQIAALARLARRLNLLVSRGVIAADGDHDLDLWVRARPEGDAIALAIGGWTHRPARAAPAPVQRERDHDFMRTTADWLWETDDGLRLTALSADQDQILPGDMLGRPLTALFHFVESADGALPILEALAAQRRFDGQAAEVRATGAPVRLAAVPLIDGRGRFSGYRGSAVADVPSAPLESGAAAAPADAFGERLDAALRQPLGRIVASAEMIGARVDGPLRADYADYATDIASAGRHLLALVDDLVDLQAIERPDFAPAAEPLDLADLARRASGLLTVRAAARAVTIDAPDSDESLPATGDFRRALQILVNLIGNAVRHSPDGGMIWVRVEREEDLAVVIVADQGRGIDPADHARIFEKFERLGLTDSAGSGLGLYIARRLARAMGGDIAVDSAAGQGARFVFTLPLAG
ncbi:MAG: PAS domain-containing sensor histidine kinase [Sphingomonas sp. SCN 67-18]|uniref:sensor histidine kinase n=1 Tax=uncultured Sphingomonas sp. TaxID=158754 RepID=UPI00086C5B8C|nr:HAMP domain-containing sensor histidine kinase [Sphingomonas sp. SCN 67-18]ODU20738.1 MAG: PAS domain-containing sensor histidine kinase [Sphingomonas sp. SCN 67-18]